MPDSKINTTKETTAKKGFKMTIFIRKCPKCGSRKVSIPSECIDITHKHPENAHYHCFECDHEWQ
jgi:DNA-directed RNA polymerase subunit M/transcription elongation factor TFIIS